MNPDEGVHFGHEVIEEQSRVIRSGRHQHGVVTASADDVVLVSLSLDTRLLPDGVELRSLVSSQLLSGVNIHESETVNVSGQTMADAPS